MQLKQVNFSRSVPVIAEPDVLVVGAGCAGTAAAIVSGRRGASTLVVERTGFAGGYITNVVGASMDGFVDLRSGLPIVGGPVFDLVRLAARTDATGDIAHTRFRFNAELGQMRGVMDRAFIRFDIERFKLAADSLMLEAGVRLLYHATVADVVRDGPRASGVLVATKAGLGMVRPRTVVDASGDADVVAYAGAPFDLDAATLQPMSLHFRIGSVEPTPELRDECARVLQEAHAEGRLPLYGGPWISYFDANDLYFNATRIRGNPLDADDLSRAEVQGRRDARLMFELFQERIPGFANSYFVTSGPMVGVRESRRVRGESVLTHEDIVAHRRRDDVVCLGGWWLDRHPTDTSGYHEHRMTRPYDIGYQTLVPRGLENVWVAGRCHSAEQAALASSRVTVTCMGMGQAAGTAAALACETGAGARELELPRLQRHLLEDGAIILDRADEVRRVGDELGDVTIESASR